MVYFIGAGPGAADLVTLRGARAIAAADIVIWGRRLLLEELVTDHARADAELLPWPPLSAGELLETYDRAREQGLVVARLYAGDSALYAKLRKEASDVLERGLRYEIVPGVSSATAAAAALGGDLTGADDSPPVILAHRRTLEGEAQATDVRGLARHGGTLVLFMSAKDPHELQRQLTEGGYGGDTPCAVAHQVSWPDELIFTCPLRDLGDRLLAAAVERQTLILVGPALATLPARRARPF